MSDDSKRSGDDAAPARDASIAARPRIDDELEAPSIPDELIEHVRRAELMDGDAAAKSDQRQAEAAEAALRAQRERDAAARAARLQATREEEARHRAAAAAEQRARDETERKAKAARDVKEREERAAFVRDNALGPLLVGARATAGKHDLKQVERDLRIKARYLDAIEKLDADNLPAEAYLYGYVRAYAAYLQPHLVLTVDEAWNKFKSELEAKTGQPLRGSAERSGEAGQARKPRKIALPSAETLAKAKEVAAKVSALEAEAAPRSVDVVIKDPSPVQGREISPSKRLAERAAAAKAATVAPGRGAAPEGRSGGQGLASWAIAAGVLVAIVGVGYGGWMALRQAQRVTTAEAEPGVEELVVVAAIGEGAAPDVARPPVSAYEPGGVLTEIYEPPADAALSDGPISSIDPEIVGAYRAERPSVNRPAPDPEALEAIERAVASLAPAPDPAPPEPALAVRAIEDVWLRIRNGAGGVVFAGIMRPGEMAVLPPEYGPYDVRAGNAGGAVVVVEAVAYGPVGERGQIASMSLDPAEIAARFELLPEVSEAIARETAGASETALLEIDAEAVADGVQPARRTNTVARPANARRRDAAEIARPEPSGPVSQ